MMTDPTDPTDDTKGAAEGCKAKIERLAAEAHAEHENCCGKALSPPAECGCTYGAIDTLRDEALRLADRPDREEEIKLRRRCLDAEQENKRLAAAATDLNDELVKIGVERNRLAAEVERLLLIEAAIT